MKAPLVSVSHKHTHSLHNNGSVVGSAVKGGRKINLGDLWKLLVMTFMNIWWQVENVVINLNMEKIFKQTALKIERGRHVQRIESIIGLCVCGGRSVLSTSRWMFMCTSGMGFGPTDLYWEAQDFHQSFSSSFILNICVYLKTERHVLNILCSDINKHVTLSNQSLDLDVDILWDTATLESNQHNSSGLWSREKQHCSNTKCLLQ